MDEFTKALDTLKASGKFEYPLDVNTQSTGEWWPYAYSPCSRAACAIRRRKPTCANAPPLLKVADGMPAARVAHPGLLRPRKPDTLYAWLDRFIDAGIDGLRVRAGRGRKGAFSPSLHDR
jgi:hypothetical protein